MNLDKAVLRMAGAFVLITVLLAVYHNINWLWLTGFVGLNMLQASFTGFCPATFVFKKMGIGAGEAFK